MPQPSTTTPAAPVDPEQPGRFDLDLHVRGRRRRLARGASLYQALDRIMAELDHDDEAAAEHALTWSEECQRTEALSTMIRATWTTPQDTGPDTVVCGTITVHARRPPGPRRR